MAKKRTGGKRKGGGRKRTTRAKPRKKNKIELRGMRKELRSHVQKLGTAIGTSSEPQPQLEETLKRLSRWLDDIEAICGPNMSVPLS